MRSTCYSLLASLFLCGACAGPPSPQASPPVATLDEHAPRWLAEHDVPSVAVAYIEDGMVQWTKVYGEQSEGVPATETTLYNVASLTKPVVAETILRLAAAGKLSLDEPLASYWIDPDVAEDPRHEQLTPRLALSHQAGFPNWRYQTEDVLTFQFAPGAGVGYSGEGYEYTARFAQNKLGASLETLAQQCVLEPLGMTNTAFSQQTWFAGRVAMPKGPEGIYILPSFQRTGSAADDLYTTIGDYATFLTGVMNRDGLPDAYADERDAIQAEAPLTCDAPVPAACPERVGFGLGWFTSEHVSETVRWHTGGDRSEQAIAFYYPAHRKGAVVFTNGAHGFQVIVPVMELLFPHSEFVAFHRSRLETP